jgi:glycosyltransferase involved in cell wall biosynthesis
VPRGEGLLERRRLLKARGVQKAVAGRGIRDGVLAVFPGFASVGGVQVSGQVAWDGIVESLENEHSGSGRRRAYRLSYGDREDNDFHPDEHVIHAAGRLGAVRAVLGRRWNVSVVLVWHLGLARLLPFLRVDGARVFVVLFGIEGWRRLDSLTRVVLRRVDMFLSISDYTWERFVSANPRYRDRPHRTVHLGISHAMNGTVRSPGRIPVVLMLGRLMKSEDYKGHREMVDAWPLVLQRVPQAELWIAGDGDLRGDLQRYVGERRLDHRVRFWGQVSERRKEELLLESHCLALPSRGEGFGLVYLEAMRLGRPCLVSTVDAGREIVNPPEAGLAVDPGNAEALAEAVVRLLSPGPDWDGWSARARQRYEGYFTAVHFQRRLVAALREVS